MTIIIVPTERCPAKCLYCFQTINQHVEGEGFTYDFNAIKRGLEEVWKGPYRGSDVTLHGGECLMVPLPELDRLLGLIYNLPWREGKIKGSSSIMTNGMLITDEHIKLFKKWNTYVGMSVDGPAPLNIYRGPDPSNPLITEEYNKRLTSTIEKLRKENIPVSIICVLHKGNSATVKQLSQLGAWLLWLRERGITGGRLNPVCSDTHPELELTNYELHRVWLNAYNWNKKYNISWNPVIEMEKNLLGGKVAPCVFSQCDPFNTHTLSVLPNGTCGNCDRTFGHGIYPRSESGSNCGRYEALRQTECKDCKYWTVCSASCPYEAIDEDWRHKSRYCEAIYKTYQYIEDKLKEEGKFKKLPEIDEKLLIKPIGGDLGNKAHGDDPHGDDPHMDSRHSDNAHQDIPHGDDQHGDSCHADAPDHVYKRG